MDNATYDIYLKNLIKNYSIDEIASSTAEVNFIKKSRKKNNKIGGSDQVHHPTGGFPPIYECSDCISKEELVEQNTHNDKKTREYESHKSSVSIKTIMDKRKEITPFISLSVLKKN